MAGASRLPHRLVLAMAVLGFGLALAALGFGLAPGGLARAGALRLSSRTTPPAAAQVMRRLPGSAPLHLTVTLIPRDPGALAAYARAVSNPDSSAYHRYLTPRQFARRFGASAAQVAWVRRALRARGLHPGPTSAGHLSIPLATTAAEVRRGLSISLLKLALPGRRSAVAASAGASRHGATARLIQSIIGLDTVASPHPLLIRPRIRSRTARGRPRSRTAGTSAASPHLATGGPQPCSPARAAASAQNAHTADQIASAYGFSGLYRAGDRGARTTVAIYELEPNLPSDIAAYQACYGTHATIAYVPIDGGVGTGSGSGEAALDIENLIGLAPGANLLVYQGPNSSSDAPGSGPYDTFSAIINQDRARVISVSWGECEAMLGAANAKAENLLFQQAAIEGQSIVAASGDSGAEDCNSTGGVTPNAPAVDDPSSQPYVTGVGGTTLRSLGPRPSESVWNASGNLVDGRLAPGAGGGGISQFWAMAPDQLHAAAALNVLVAGPSGSVCGHPGGYCREVPDVSADADPATGYEIYFNGDAADAGQPSGWQTLGGTSGAAPVWTALLALTDASGACAGSPVGFANPALYRAGGGAYAAAFNDVRRGENDFTGTNGGRYGAGPGYDEASGLGTPNATALAAELCANTVRLTSPGLQRSALGTDVSLALRADHVRGAGLDFSAVGLPSGLALSSATGRISGRPRRTGTFAVVVSARDPQGAVARTTFRWTIGSAPRISEVTLTGVAAVPQRHPQLSFTVTAGRGAPGFSQLTVTLPDALKLTSAAAVRLQAVAARSGGREPGFSARLAHGGLEVTLRHASSGLRITLAYPQLRASTGRLAQARGGGPLSFELTVQILDASAGTATLRAGLKPIRSG